MILDIRNTLMQFDVTSYAFKSSDNDCMVVAEITFRRKLMYHLTNTYLPTTSLLVIVELTLYLDDSKLDVAVTLSLTVLLVMYTLYQSISMSTPKTAYLKLIDYWLIFCLLVPFLIFLIETAWYLDMTRKERKGKNTKGVSIESTNLRGVQKKLDNFLV
jgi:hypothetical protein